MILSRGARLCESIIRNAKARRGGVRVCGRPYLARRLGCSQRTVSRYLRELRNADRLDVTPPARVRTSAGWRTAGVNSYRLTASANPAPHVTGPHIRRSRRGDTHVTPSPKGARVGRPRGLHRPAPGADQPLIDPTAAAQRLFALVAAHRSGA